MSKPVSGFIKREDLQTYVYLLVEYRRLYCHFDKVRISKQVPFGLMCFWRDKLRSMRLEFKALFDLDIKQVLLIEAISNVVLPIGKK